MSSFQVATLNAHHGKSPDRAYSTRAMCESISALDVDVLCLQELDVWALRTWFAHQPKKIAKAHGFHYSVTRVRFFGLGFQYNAILSRFPILSSREEVLPRKGRVQSRKCLTTVIDIDSRAVSITTAHLHSHGRVGKPNPLAEKQLEFLLQSLSDGGADLVAGDLNLLPKSVEPIAQKYSFDAPHSYPTSPSDVPRNQIDWILARGVSLSNVHTSDHLSSDHRALIATVSTSS